MKLHSSEQIEQYEQTGVWGDETLLDQFTQTVEKTPQREAVVDPPNVQSLVGRSQERLTYAEFDERIEGIAQGLQEYGLGKDDVVVVQLPNTWELAALYLAISKAGGVISPLPMQWRRHELNHVVELTDAELYISIDEFNGFEHVEMGEEMVENEGALKSVVDLSEIQEMSRSGSETQSLNDVTVEGNDVFNIEWTSGTTADPKACPMTHNNWSGIPILPLLDFDRNNPERVLCAAPLVNMNAIGVNFIPWLFTGGTLILHHPIDFSLLVEQLQTEDVTFTILVPAIMNNLLKHPQVDEFDLSTIETVATGAAAPAEWALQEFRDRWGIEIVNIWGQNEGTGIVSGPKTTPLTIRATHFPQFGGQRDGADWGTNDPRVETIQTKITDPETRETVTEVGEIGELAYKGPGVIAGYYRQPELTEQAFDDEGYFYTGDLFKIEEDGFMSFFDRKKDVIIRGGYTISAKEVENVITELPMIADAAVVGMPDENLGERVCLYAVPSEGEVPTLEDVTEELEGDLAIYKHPERLELVEEIPRNPIGKVVKSELRHDIKSKVEPESNEGGV